MHHRTTSRPGPLRALLAPALLAAALGVLCGAPGPAHAAGPVVTVNSLNPDAGVWITPCCGMNACPQFVQETPFTMSCPAGTPVRLEAPATFGETPFTEWRRVESPPYPYATFIFVPDTDVTLTVVYGNPVEPLTDFVVTDIALTPASPVSGTTFSAQVTVANQGAAAQTLSVWLDLWTDRAAAPGCGVAGNAARSFGSLAAGASRVLTFTGLTAGPAGSATFRASADSFCAVAEADETNNQATLVYTVRPRTILSVSSVNPANAVVDAAPADLLGLAGGTAPFTRSYAPGATVTLTAPAAAGGNVFQKWLLDGGDAGGSRALAVTMDADHTLSAVYVRPPLPDFVVTNITLPDTPTAGFAFRASVTVKNAGTASGDAGALAVWPDRLDNPACGDFAGQPWVQAGVLAPGESRTFDFTSLGPVSAGNRYFRAYVEAGCAVGELVDNNNNSVKSYLVVARETRQVRVDTLDGRRADITHTMDVTGEVGGRTPFTRTYPRDATVTITAPATTPDGGVFQKWTGLEPVVPTTLAVAVKMDGDKGIEAVYVGPGEPDFAVTGLSVDPPDPPAGGTFAATVTITNVGTGRGVPGTLRLFPDRSAPANCWATSIYGPMYIRDLAAGASLTWTIPGIPAGPRGARSLLAFVDSFCGTGEPDEANNQAFAAYEAVNVPPVLGAVGDRDAAEGATLSFTVAATDANGDPLTWEATGLPDGASFDPATRTFSWTPGFAAAGSYPGVRFAVSDGEAADEETITIEVAEPAGPIFADDFSDLAAAGAAVEDPWLPLAGPWVRGGGVYTAASGRIPSLTRVAFLDPETLPIGAGVVQARLKLTGTASGSLGPNAQIVFGLADPAHYRWVRFLRGRVQIGQTGTMDGIAGGRKRSAAATLRTGAWYRFTVRIDADGWVRVYRGTATRPLASYRFLSPGGFPSVVPGGVGLATAKAKALFDDVAVWEDSALAPPGAAGAP